MLAKMPVTQINQYNLEGNCFVHNQHLRDLRMEVQTSGNGARSVYTACRVALRGRCACCVT